jgi:2-polyprenyl-3-methyl-5-hydroxy-6-metoxy-1,4-benzoquinol methylase
MIEKARGIRGLATTRADAASFSRRSDVPPYDVALLKEVVHHVPSDDVDQLYAGIHRQLSPGGVVLSVTRWGGLRTT